jgi:hypothetical protein
VVPIATGVISPTFEIVAMAVEADVHGVVPLGVPEPVKVIVLPKHVVKAPEIVAPELIVIVAFTVQFALFLYVIIAVPAEMPVTKPTFDTVATAVFEETQGVIPFTVPEPVNVVVPPIQAVNIPVIVGEAAIVTPAVTVQFDEFLYVILEVPTASPVTTPVEETVAIVGDAEVQGVVGSGVPEPIKVVPEPIQVFVTPVIVGWATIVTNAETVQLLEFLYVILVVPTATLVTKPVVETVAIVGADESHGVEPAAVAEPVNCVEEPKQADKLPVIVGKAVTVRVAVVVQLFEFVYVIVVVPADTPVTIPVLEIVATAVFEEIQGLTTAGLAEPVKLVFAPVHILNVPEIVGGVVTVIIPVIEQLFEFV